jgi:hypothetical protein
MRKQRDATVVEVLVQPCQPQPLVTQQGMMNIDSGVMNDDPPSYEYLYGDRI